MVPHMFYVCTMNEMPAQTERETVADAHARRLQRNLQVVDALVEISLDLTRVLQAQAKTEVETAARLGEPAPDFTVAAERMTRIVRRTVLLSDKLNDKLITPAPTPAAKHHTAARKQIIREVEDSIDHDAPAEAAESLRAEFQERLDSPDIDDDIETRPVEEIITEIRRDLGIAAPPGARPRWKRRTPKDVALLCVRAAAKRPAEGPFVLPMPPRNWAYTDELCPRPEARPGSWDDAGPIRGP
jgi:hypothetical protein